MFCPCTLSTAHAVQPEQMSTFPSVYSCCCMWGPSLELVTATAASLANMHMFKSALLFHVHPHFSDPEDHVRMRSIACTKLPAPQLLVQNLLLHIS